MPKPDVYMGKDLYPLNLESRGNYFLEILKISTLIYLSTMQPNLNIKDVIFSTT